MQQGLSALFIRKGLVNEEEMARVILQSNQKKLSLVTTLINMNLATSQQVADLCYAEYGTPLIDLDEFDLTSIPDSLLNTKLIEKHRCIPLYKQGNTVYIGTSDPTNIIALEEFQFSTGLHAQALLVEDDQLIAALDKVLEEDITQLDLGDIDDEQLALVELEDTERQADSEDVDFTDDAPIVMYVNKLLTDAIKRGASDVHFEPYEKRCRIRFRVDGILGEVSEPPISLSARISARLKVMAKLDIAEKRVPQDGRIKMKVSRSKSVDFRVSTLPTLWGEKIVIRILDSTANLFSIEELGCEKEQSEIFDEMLHKAQGMILVTGPTGSGKTVSLYAGLSTLNQPDRNISAVEDPVEMQLEGINQVPINLKAGLTFASALRAFLRQDPDVVMVGEIRDLETAEIAIKAAQTGHLVLSTLHTNSAAETLTRLVNMGVPGYNLASSVKLIIAQRLARRLCPSCRAVDEPSEEHLLELGFTQEQLDAKPVLYKAVGCDQCTDGYKGRIGCYEMLVMTESLATLVMSGGSSLDLDKLAIEEGMITLRQSSLLKVIRGATSILEANRICSV
jgi:type IV pilus assembly protein PilB